MHISIAEYLKKRFHAADTIDKEITQQLLKYLEQKRCLIILDNFESVLLTYRNAHLY